MSKYIVEEVVHYEVEAESAQEAIDFVIEYEGRDALCVSVEDRSVVDGPIGWTQEEYESP